MFFKLKTKLKKQWNWEYQKAYCMKLLSKIEFENDALIQFKNIKYNLDYIK